MGFQRQYFNRVRMSRISVKEKLWSSIRRSQDNVFLRADFDRFGEYRQVSRSVRELVSEGLLLRVGYGTYVKTRPSSLFGKPVPADTLLNVAFAVMKKLGVKADVGRDAKALREGRSTQVPMLPVVNVGKARVSRKISYGNKTVVYERE